MRDVPIHADRERRCCWVGLPSVLANEILAKNEEDFPIFLKLKDVQYHSPLGIVCWSGDIVHSGGIAVSTELCSILEIVHQQRVRLEVLQNVVSVKRVTMKCVSEADYELMNIEREFFESHILSQGALVVRNQLLPVWLRQQNLPIHVMPLDMSPSTSFGRMTADTELEILSPSDPIPNRRRVEDTRSLNSKRNVRFNGLASEITPEGSSEIQPDVESGKNGESSKAPSRIHRKRSKNDISQGLIPPSETKRPSQSTLSSEKKESSQSMSNSEETKESSQSTTEKPRQQCVLRLQRSPETSSLNLATKMTLNTDSEPDLEFLKPNASLHEAECHHWFPSNLSISTPLSTVVFVHPNSLETAGWEVGDFVLISDKNMKDSLSSENITVLRVFISNCVTQGHCVMHDVVASELNLKYCQKVFVMTARPTIYPLNGWSELILRPTKFPHSQTDKTKETRPRLSSDKPESGTAFLSTFFKELDASVFLPSEENSPVQESAENKNSFYNTMMQTIESWTKTFSFAFHSASTSENRSRPTETVQAEGVIALLLRTLFMCWIEAQLNASWSIHHQLRTNPLSLPRLKLRRHTHQAHFQNFCITPRQRMHFTFYAEDGTEKTSLVLQIQFGRKGIRQTEGILMEQCSLRHALREQRCRLFVGVVKSLRLEDPDPVPSSFLSCSTPPWLQKDIQECIDLVKLAFKTTQNRSTSIGILITGPHQSSKTSFASTVCRSLVHDLDVLSHVYYVDCLKDWSSTTEGLAKVASLKSKTIQQITKAVDFAPSVVVLDNVDSQVVHHEDAESVNLVSKRVTMMIKDVMEQTRTKGWPVVFLATSKSVKDMDGSLCDSGFFDTRFEMPTLDSGIRREILKSLFEKNKMEMDSKALSNLSEWDAGFEYADLERLAQRAVHCHLQSGNRECSMVMQDDLKNALDGFEPAAQWKVHYDPSKLHRRQNSAILYLDAASMVRGLEDVGGMKDVKTILRDCVELPIQFPQLVQQCPLRLMSNVLLYGPPGSGKTFIVHALKASLDVRLVSVKGPELLNKYIGQSEAAVRSTFKTASEAAPCILFFDEFEALGRHRGSESSGVSDRVVNQLLTEMDGVQGLSGVCVIAATSRPDLIDKALLRPGRFDRHVFCALPKENDRLEILQILAQKQKLDEEIDLEEIVEKTEGYSGADLMSIFSEAHLFAAREYLKQPETEFSEKMITITQEAMDYAIKHSRPSSSEKEKRFLNEIYSNFSNGKVCMSRSNTRSKDKELTFA